MVGDNAGPTAWNSHGVDCALPTPAGRGEWPAVP